VWKTNGDFGTILAMKKQSFFLLAALAASASASFGGEVKCTRAPMALETYPVGAPEKNPMFFEKRSHAYCSVRMKTKGDRNDMF
jgi:hypothetical protein